MLNGTPGGDAKFLLVPPGGAAKCLLVLPGGAAKCLLAPSYKLKVFVTDSQGQVPEMHIKHDLAQVLTMLASSLKHVTDFCSSPVDIGCL